MLEIGRQRIETGAARIKQIRAGVLRPRR